MKLCELPIISFNEIPSGLRELARRMENGEISNVANVTVVISGPDSMDPAVYNFGKFGMQQTVGCLTVAAHRLMTYRSATRSPLRKPT